MKIYTEPEVYQFLETEIEWRSYTDDGEITATYEFKDFLEALSFVNDIAEIAEEMQHHPSLEIRYNVVIVTLCTHDEEWQITELDTTLARAIEELVL